MPLPDSRERTCANLCQPGEHYASHIAISREVLRALELNRKLMEGGAGECTLKETVRENTSVFNYP